MLWAALQVVAGMVFGNLLEWVVHRYFLHGIGKNPKSILAFHWRGHHRYSRKNGFRDPDYDETIWAWNGKTKELAALGFLALLFVPTVFVAPWLYVGMFSWVFIYYFVHSYAHQNPEWAKRWLPWHYEHHMGRNQDANWSVTFPLWDHIFRTRVPHVEDARGRLVPK